MLAPDSFKGSASAAEVARWLAVGWRRAQPDDVLVELPMADGGEGSAAIVAAARPESVGHAVRVTGPDGAPVDAGWLLLGDGTAVVELASSSGLPLVTTPNALNATTYGFGELLRAAVGHPSVRRIMVTLGGSATTDGGCGALSALGARFLDADGSDLPRGGGSLRRLATVRPTTIAPPTGGVTGLTDVTAPLLGVLGAATQFGPQKGATPEQVDVLEAGLRRLDEVLGGDASLAGSGAAGGTAYGLVTMWGATLTPGARQIAAMTGLPEAIARADLVVTGEGRFDEQSLRGKVVGYVVDTARTAGVRVGLAAGGIAAPLPVGVTASVELAALAGGPRAAIDNAQRWLVEAGERLADAAHAQDG